MRRILITGSNSYVGTNVEHWLMRELEKYQVDTIDMIDGSWREKDLSGYDVVFHVAGIAHVNAKQNMESLYYKINTDLAIETAQHAKRCGVKQFIFMSSMIVYGESKSLKPVVITRDTEPKPNGFYGNSKLQAEIGIKKLEDDQFKVVILRPPMIYGPGSKGNFPKLMALAKRTPVFPAYHNQRSMLYINNLCEFVRLVVDNEVQGTFFPQNDEYVDTCEVVRQVAKEAHHKIWVTRFLNPGVVLGAFFVSSFNKMWGSFTYAKETATTIFEYKQITSVSTSIRKTCKALS